MYLIVSSRDQYGELLKLLESKSGETDLEDRKAFAAKAFAVSSHYDSYDLQLVRQGMRTMNSG